MLIELMPLNFQQIKPRWPDFAGTVLEKQLKRDLTGEEKKLHLMLPPLEIPPE